MKPIILYLIALIVLSIWIFIFINLPSPQETKISQKELDGLSSQIISLRNIIQHNDEIIHRLRTDLDRINVADDVIIQKHNMNFHKVPDIGMRHKQADENENQIASDIAGPWSEPIPILVFVCNRPSAITNHLNKLVNQRPSIERFPIIVSQDCDNDDVRRAVEKFGDKVQYIKHISGEKANITIPINHRHFTTYYRIARHYKLALEYIFNTKKYTSVVITEDDLDIAVDFFEYFSATRYLLEKDSNLWCVSAWNDNGKTGIVDPSATSILYRTDFFSGLGWMMTSTLWNELGPIWPSGFWDDWMRDPLRRKNRHCIRPEISRTGMTKDGKDGASKGQFFARHLAKVNVNKSPVDFTHISLDYLLQANYDRVFEETVFESAQLMTIQEAMLFIVKPNNTGKSIRIEYNANRDYILKADKLMIMHDFKAGVPRTAYKGVVTCFIGGIRIYLAPDRKMITSYNPSWEVPPEFGD